jgi:deoxyribodipyrimidine photo-lyase
MSLLALKKYKEPISVIWFRQDLRVLDNPALIAAQQEGLPIVPIFIHDPDEKNWPLGEASRWWLHHSLLELNKKLEHSFLFLNGSPEQVFENLISKLNIKSIFWNRRYDPHHIKSDKALKAKLKAHSIAVKTYNGLLLKEPMETLKEDQTPYRVFTPFFKQNYLLKPETITAPHDQKIDLNLINLSNSTIDSLNLLPKTAWYNKLSNHWTPGEDGAHINLEVFLSKGLKNYKDGRNFPEKYNTSKLSPHLHFGEISPQTIWHKTIAAMIANGLEKDGEHFLSELCWREFSYSLIYHFPTLPDENYQNKFDAFPWKDNEIYLRQWKKGLTGYPLVDAGMRELWETGYMHNRVRMVVASFLIKNLLIHWKEGEKWFWDTLVDADLANNSASWQWVAGSGADAAPYFRIFNPVTQSKKFDPDAIYIKKFVPELKDLPTKYIHEPWLAPQNVLSDAGITLGINYPHPLVDLKSSRETALEAYKELSN